MIFNLLNYYLFFLNRINFFGELNNIYIFYLILVFQELEGIGDWGLGIGDWGLGIGPNTQSPNPNPKTQNPVQI